MLKNTLATTIAIILGLIPAVVRVFGKATYLAAMTTVFGHPGRRFGMMAEALVLVLLGTLLGTAWSTFGIYLSSLVYNTNSPAAYTIKGIFLTIAILFHGYLRSHTPRLFLFVLLLVIVSVVSLTSPETAVSIGLVTTILYPILTAVGILLVVNVTVFPEFSSDFLGITTIQTLSQTVDALRDAGIYFVSTLEPDEEEVKKSPENDDSSGKSETVEETAQKPNVMRALSVSQRALESIKRLTSKITGAKAKVSTKEAGKKSSAPSVVKLKSLTDQKSKLRTKLGSCKAAQQECMFEFAFTALPPRDLKPISHTAMKKLVANTIALISACESKYALLGDKEDSKSVEADEVPENTETPSHSRATSRQSSMNLDSDAGGTSNDDQESQESQESEKEEIKKRKIKRRKHKIRSRLKREKEELEMVKPHKEIESADEQLLKYLLNRIKDPLQALQQNIDRSVEVITSCLAYCYDVSKLPSGSLPPKGIKLQELDIYIDALRASMADFDKTSYGALESATTLYDIQTPQVDIMPRMETFLISSFLLNLRQAATHTQEMLEHSRKLVAKRQARHDRRTLWAPRINWRKWLSTGGEQDMLALPDQARKNKRQGMGKEQKDNGHAPDESQAKPAKSNDIEDLREQEPTQRGPIPLKSQKVKPKKDDRGAIARLRINLADFMEAVGNSDDAKYAIKLAVAVILVTWPSFVSQWNTWYYLNRGLWAALQLVLITEVAIGATVWIFLLRIVGTTIGCCWGLAAFEASKGNRVVAVVMLVIGIVPSAYVQLGTKYIKAGMVCIISMCIVVLATLDNTVSGTAIETFLKRLIAFLIGAFVALAVQFVILPVRARDRLVESLAAAIRKITEMEACLAHGIESGKNIGARSPEVSKRFEVAQNKAQDALAAAGTFLPFCAQEPRLKGSFAGLALVYQEVLYVLHQIIDRMDNMLQLRKEYGSAILEDLNEEVYAYRRNLAGSITLILFAVHEALTTKLPLPQFLPSARLAHMRLVNRVRELLLGNEDDVAGEADDSERSQIEMTMVRRLVRQKFLSWNATSAGQVEIIEYLEELIDLTKLLVGANEFRSGLLTRPTYKDYLERITVEVRQKNKEKLEVHRVRKPTQIVPPEAERRDGGRHEDEMVDTVPEKMELGIKRMKTRLFGHDDEETCRRRKASDAEIAETLKRKLSNEDELPLSLQRVRSKRIEEQNLERVKSQQSQHSSEEKKKAKRS
jgi:uncharacterized membrane protein YgaE (UPF0421/DUF939 family)